MADAITLEDLLSLRETSDVEFKKSSGIDGKGAVPKDFWLTYSAFANSDGGDIYLGIEEDESKKPVLRGIQNTSKVRQQLFDLANNKEKVSINLLTNEFVEDLHIDGRTIIRVHVPKAQRKQRPVYVGINPLTGCYRRFNEGDYPASTDFVKKALSEQIQDTADAYILKGYTIEDLDQDTLKAYRNNFAARSPSHPFVTQGLEEFLRSIGAWRTDRETGQVGLTLAGLLMFGKLRSILDELPNYIVDYQERSLSKTESRWIDRLTTDGNWSGNLYDFYRRVYQKLISDLKVPFKLEGATRVDETPVHEALREALVNTLVHADYSGRLSVLVMKKSDMFRFRNPGLMRIPVELARQGGSNNSDCRNRNLQKMFQHIGAGEQAGSGIPKIYQNWQQQNWRIPVFKEQTDPEQTVFDLHMTSLLPAAVIAKLDATYGERFRNLPELERLILITAATEHYADHKRIRAISENHPADISKALGGLTKNGFLRTYGTGRGTVYFLPNSDADKMFKQIRTGSLGLVDDILGLEEASLGLEDSSLGLDERELKIASQAKDSRKLNRTQMEDIIVQLCDLKPQSLEKLGQLLDRSPEFLRSSYIKSLIEAQKLELLFPKSLRNPQQAYLTPNLRSQLSKS